MKTYMRVASVCLFGFLTTAFGCFAEVEPSEVEQSEAEEVGEAEQAWEIGKPPCACGGTGWYCSGSNTLVHKTVNSEGTGCTVDGSTYCSKGCVKQPCGYADYCRP